MLDKKKGLNIFSLQKGGLIGEEGLIREGELIGEGELNREIYGTFKI